MTPAIALPKVNPAQQRCRRLRAYVMEAKYETLRMLRVPGFAGPFLILPVGLYLLFAVVLFGAEIGKDPKSAMFIFMGFATFGVMGPGMFGFGAGIATEREQGLWRLNRSPLVGLYLEQTAYRAVGLPSEGIFAIHLLALAAITLGCTCLAVRRLVRVG